MEEDFQNYDSQNNFDFKGFLYKLLRQWPLFLISLIIAFSIAYYINVRKQPIYQISNLVSIKDDQNPFFTSNTSLTFNWGGTTDKVNTAVITLKSRSHNEEVVEHLQYYVEYLKDGKYHQEDAYRQTPFFVEVDVEKPQILGQQLRIVFKDSVNFTMSSFFESGDFQFQNYNTKEITKKYIEEGEFTKDFSIGETINLDYFNGKFMPNPDVIATPGMIYYIIFQNYDNIVKRYLMLQVEPESRGSSVLRMKLDGNNKAKLVDYLNSSVKILSQSMLERKNLFATKTIRFIDSSLTEKSTELSMVEDELNQFKNKNAIFDLQTEGSEISSKLSELDLRKEIASRELNYYNTLNEYLTTRTDYRNVPAPSVAGISEASVVSGVGKIVSMAEERNKLQYSFKETAPIFNDIDRKIDAVKIVLLENIRSSTALKNQELNILNQNMGRFESQIRKLPKEQQDLLKIERRYNLSQGSYNMFLEKRSEAGLVKAANVSDVMVIDSAKDTGGGKIGPNTNLNYLMAGLMGLFIPFLFVFGKAFFDTKIGNINDLALITSIPILGVVVRSHLGKNNNLAVLNAPSSAIAESFRSLRSSLQFIYKKQGVKGAKTVLVTSSVGGEGKSFCSINIASVFALSQKSTVLVELDLRKPKIAQSFGLDNSIGVVNYLIEQAEIADIIQNSGTDYLDVIVSGNIPPNPSELLLSERLKELLDVLKKDYDYIILDSPPLGLVSDALELIKHVDASLYITRLNYTHKNMLNIVNDKYKSGEIKNVSIVLNDYIEKSGSKYGYGYNFGGYSKGYHNNEKPAGLFNKIRKKTGI